MNIFLESFDNWSSLTVATSGKWTSKAGTSIAIDTSVPRTGIHDLKLTYAAASTDNYLGKVVPARARYTIGVALQVDSIDASNPIGLIQWLSGATKQLTLELHPNGSLSVNSGDTGGAALGTTAAGVVVSGSFYIYIELFVLFNQANGFVIIRVNGTEVLNLGGLNTDPAASGTGTEVRLGGFPGGVAITSTYHFDDLYLNNDIPPYNTGFEATPAQTVRVYEFNPTANGTTVDFLPFPQTSPNWQDAAPINPLDDSAYVQDNTTGDLDLYEHGSLPATVTAVLAVQQSAVAKKIAGVGTLNVNAFVAISNAMRSGEIESDADGVNTTTSYAWYLNVRETDPNTRVPFTVAGCDDAEIGVKVALNE